MNKCFYMGNLTKDAELKTTSNDIKVARTSMALNRGKDKDGNDKGADFINLVAFGKRAEFLDKFGKKGRRFLAECHVQTGSYDKEGQKVYTTDFVVDSIEFADSKPSDAQPTQAAPTDDFMMIPDDIQEELPFN